MVDEDRLRVKATATSFRVVDALVDLGGAGVTELADHLDLSKSGVHNHLTTLEELGYVVRDGDVFRPSLQFLETGARIRRTRRLYQVAAGEIDRLARASGVVAGAFVLEGSRVVCLHCAAGGKVERPLLAAGDVRPLHSTAPGKAILAASPKETAGSLLDAADLREYTDSTVTDRDELQEELQRVRARGLAFDREEHEPSVRGIATTVAGADGEVLGAVGVVSSTEFMSGKRFQQDLPGLVISSANRVEKSVLNDSPD